ncbi:hypothetical protein KR074_011301, partial [Drosophila pseudoananassae]
LGSYYGTAADAMGVHRNMKFTIYDNDNDNSKDNCAARYTGAWWYNKCHQR